MSRFTERLQRADKVVDRTFAEELPVVLMVGAERRPITAIFEKPDASVEVYGGGEIRDVAPALSAYTADIRSVSDGRSCAQLLQADARGPRAYRDRYRTLYPTHQRC